MVIAENVKGLIMGNARGYVKEIFQSFREAGYDCQLFLLNASRMGVPQVRIRTFFIARLSGPKIKLEFDEPAISIKQAWEGLINQHGKPLSTREQVIWPKIPKGKSEANVKKDKNCFNNIKLSWLNLCRTISSNGSLYHPNEPRHVSDMEFIRIQTFPDDYNFNGNNAQYLCGMSVPPYMMERIAGEIERQAFRG